MSTYPDIDFRNSMSSPTARDSANVYIQGSENFKVISLPMFTMNAAAALVAEWYLRDLSTPQGHLECVVNRKACKVQIGDRVRVTHSKIGLNQTVFRVVHMADAEIESGKISLVLQEEKVGKLGEVTEFTTPTDLRISNPSSAISGQVYTNEPDSAYLNYKCNPSPTFVEFDPIIVKNNEWYALNSGEMCIALCASGEVAVSGEYLLGQIKGQITNSGWTWAGSGEVYINTSGELTQIEPEVNPWKYIVGTSISEHTILLKL